MCERTIVVKGDGSVCGIFNLHRAAKLLKRMI
jgi:hypothetical protein